MPLMHESSSTIYLLWYLSKVFVFANSSFCSLTLELSLSSVNHFYSLHVFSIENTNIGNINLRLNAYIDLSIPSLSSKTKYFALYIWNRSKISSPGEGGRSKSQVVNLFTAKIVFIQFYEIKLQQNLPL